MKLKIGTIMRKKLKISWIRTNDLTELDTIIFLFQRLGSYEELRYGLFSILFENSSNS